MADGRIVGQEPEVSRLDRLEARCRWLEWLVCLLFLVAVFGVFNGYRQSAMARALHDPGGDASPGGRPGILASSLRAGRVEIIDDAGRPLGEWGPNPGDEGGVSVALGTPGGARRLRLVVGRNGQPEIQLVDRDGLMRIELLVDDAGEASIRVKEEKSGRVKGLQTAPGAILSD